MCWVASGIGRKWSNKSDGSRLHQRGDGAILEDTESTWVEIFRLSFIITVECMV